MPLYDVKGETFLLSWGKMHGYAGFMYQRKGGAYFLTVPKTREEKLIDREGCGVEEPDITELPVYFTPEFKGVFATPEKNRLRLVNRAAGRTRQTLQSGAAEITASAWSRDGDQIAAGDKHGWVYRFVRRADGTFVPADKLPRFAHAQNPGPGAPEVTALAFSPDGKRWRPAARTGRCFSGGCEGSRNCKDQGVAQAIKSSNPGGHRTPFGRRKKT